MDQTAQTLLQETEKWLAKLEAVTLPQQPKAVVANLKAYIADCKHFLKQQDYIRAFEAIIYAWGIYETVLSMKPYKGVT
ncbi:MAG: DUF357 domain-containing protein [Candidatus Aenigmarchaeota archaeon]|nr:DUF357 domain-containing protein [Candidatus Aenigmarchaeota archaeon]